MKRKALGVALLIAAATWASGAAAQSATVQMLAGNCVGCHGVDGTSRGPASPNIAGMSKAYFVGAMLVQVRQGRREDRGGGEEARARPGRYRGP